MEEEQYTIGISSGFQVSGKNYYSRNFATIEEAKAHIEELMKTPKREETKTVFKKLKN